VTSSSDTTQLCALIQEIRRQLRATTTGACALLLWPKQGHSDQPTSRWQSKQQQVRRSAALWQAPASADVFLWEIGAALSDSSVCCPLALPYQGKGPPTRPAQAANSFCGYRGSWMPRARSSRRTGEQLTCTWIQGQPKLLLSASGQRFPWIKWIWLATQVNFSLLQD